MVAVWRALLLAAALCGAAAAGNATMVSICGDPGMLLPPKILLEGWNFCNRCGRACTESPRWADCVSPDGVQRVTADDNAAGLPLRVQNQSNCDAFTEQKERNLGAVCADTTGNLTSFFWTAMLKSGAMNVSERGRLCGLWCADKDPDCNTGTVDASTGEFSRGSTEAPLLRAKWGNVTWTDTNYEMVSGRAAPPPSPPCPQCPRVCRPLRDGVT